jgi:uncharacterized damage-inducible protein DinB
MSLHTIRLFARYNAHANLEMNKVLETLDAAEWDKQRGGHFSSFRSLLGHVYTADARWLLRFQALRTFSSVKGAVFDSPPSWETPPFGGFEEYQGLRQSLDAVLLSWVGELTEADLGHDISYQDSRGRPHTKNFGGLIFHVFNHQTHHRGMAALYLDEMGIANDFSNLSALL